MQPNTYSVFEYLYRDAANYKAWGKLLLSGQLEDEQMNKMLKRFDSGEFFIAEQIGIPSLDEDLWQYSNGANADDHIWHSFHSLRPATNEEIIAGNVWGSAHDLLSTILSISSWNIKEFN